MLPAGPSLLEHKFIHKSISDSSCLCQSSKQKCLHYCVHGYRFCIWHILEDDKAPYKQCDHVENGSNARCQFSVSLRTKDSRFCQIHRREKGGIAGSKRKQLLNSAFGFGEFSLLVMAASFAHHVELVETPAVLASSDGRSAVDKGLGLGTRPSKQARRERMFAKISSPFYVSDNDAGHQILSGEEWRNVRMASYGSDAPTSGKSGSFKHMADGPLAKSPPFLLGHFGGRDQSRTVFPVAVDVGPVNLDRVGLSSVSRIARVIKSQSFGDCNEEQRGFAMSDGAHLEPRLKKKRGAGHRGISKSVGVQKRPGDTRGAEICTPFDTEGITGSAYDDAAARLVQGGGAMTNFRGGDESDALLSAVAHAQVELAIQDGDDGSYPTPMSHNGTSTETDIDEDVDIEKKASPSCGDVGPFHYLQKEMTPNAEIDTSHLSKAVDCSSVEKYMQESRSFGVRKISSGRYEASVYNRLTKKMIYVGRFDTRDEAVSARDRVIENVIVDKKEKKEKVRSPQVNGKRKSSEGPGASQDLSPPHYLGGPGKLAIHSHKMVSPASGSGKQGQQERRAWGVLESCSLKRKTGDKVSANHPATSAEKQVVSDQKTSGLTDSSAGQEGEGAGGQMSAKAKVSGKAKSPVGPNISSGNPGSSERKLFGVTKKLSTGRYEASFYDRNEKRKVYVGMFETDLEAARARDQLAVQRGATSHLNFPEWAASVVAKERQKTPEVVSVEQVDATKALKASRARDRALQIAHWLKKKSAHVESRKQQSTSHHVKSGIHDSIPYAVPPQAFSRSDQSNFSSEGYTESEAEIDSAELDQRGSEQRLGLRRVKRRVKARMTKRKRGSMTALSSDDELLSEDGREALELDLQSRERNSASGFSTDSMEDYSFQDLKSEYGRVYKTTSKRRALLGHLRSEKEHSKHAPGTRTMDENDDQAECPKLKPQIASCSSQEEEFHDTVGEDSTKARRRVGEGSRCGKDFSKDVGSGKRLPRRCPYIGVQATAGGRFKSKMYLAATKQHIYVGTFDTAVEAAKAYDDMVFKRSGNVKRLNFPERYGLNVPAAKKQRVKSRSRSAMEQGSGGCLLSATKSHVAKTSEREDQEGLSKKMPVTTTAEHSSDEDEGEVSGKTKSNETDDNGKAENLVESSDVVLADDEKKRRQRKPGKTLHRHYKGVYSNGMKFKCIYYNPLAKRHTYLGSFVTAEEAARIYDQLSFWQFGESPNLKLSAEELLPSSATCYHPLSGGSGEYYGVCKTGNLYHAMFYNNRSQLPFYCGNFKTAIDAARAYDGAAFKELGADALLNFPSKLEDKSQMTPSTKPKVVDDDVGNMDQLVLQAPESEDLAASSRARDEIK